MLVVAVYGALCSVALSAGSVVSSRWWRPEPHVKGYIQHVAAGLVVAAVAVEVLPDMLHRALPLAAALGFALGVGLVMGIELLSDKLAEKRGGETPVSLIGVITTDVFIDGLLIGVAAVAGGEGGSQALLVTIALAAEMLSLGLSTGCTLAESYSQGKVAAVSAGMAAAPLAGAVGGFLVGGYVNASWTEGVLAFAAAALLYLAVEELLKEAHEVPETALANLLFFGAFFSIMIVDMVS